MIFVSDIYRLIVHLIIFPCAQGVRSQVDIMFTQGIDSNHKFINLFWYK